MGPSSSEESRETCGGLSRAPSVSDSAPAGGALARVLARPPPLRGDGRAAAAAPPPRDLEPLAIRVSHVSTSLANAAASSSEATCRPGHSPPPPPAWSAWEAREERRPSERRGTAPPGLFAPWPVIVSARLRGVEPPSERPEAGEPPRATEALRVRASLEPPRGDLRKESAREAIPRMPSPAPVPRGVTKPEGPPPPLTRTEPSA